MNDVRWNPPYSHSFAHRLFREHFTELNKIYWANTPAANTIEKEVKERQKISQDKPIDFFFVHNEDDRRIAASFDTWRTNYHNFLTFTRQNMILALNSCFEIYLRSIISLAIESKPGVIFGSKDAVDGAQLLKYSKAYTTYNEENPFYKHVESICKGTWDSRVTSYKKLFGLVPTELEDGKTNLDKMRKLRNQIAHQFGRYKNNHEIPVILEARSANGISHTMLIKYLSLVDKVEEAIDKHLYFRFVGSYEVLKYYSSCRQAIPNAFRGEKHKYLKQIIGAAGMEVVGEKYYQSLIKYFEQL